MPEYILSITIPIYNEEGNISALHHELEKLKLKFSREFSTNDRLQIIFVNDGSVDSSFSLLKTICENNEDYFLINLSRNFGHQLAVSAGLSFGSGAFHALMDGDLQDPPELILDLYKKCLLGNDVVYAKRKTRTKETYFKLLSARLFYRLLKRITKIEIPVDTGDFRVMSARVVNHLKQMPEMHRFIRGMVSWVGYKQTYVEYDRLERYSGQTKYPLSKMIKFALDGVTSFSTVPLKLTNLLGYLYAFFALLYAAYIIYLKVFTDQLVQGWAGIIVLVCITGSIQFILLGILGEYVGRIYEESKGRPNFIIENVYSKPSSS